LRKDLRNQGGGHANHSLFWQTLKKGGGQPAGELAKAIDKSFGSFAKWQEQFGKQRARCSAAVGRGSSGAIRSS
jgi:Fe-Mn family superoxide dismutase